LIGEKKQLKILALNKDCEDREGQEKISIGTILFL